MRELFVVAIVVAMAFAVSAIMKSKDWSDAEFNERFQRAVAETERACEEMQLQRSGELHATESGSFED